MTTADGATVGSLVDHVAAGDRAMVEAALAAGADAAERDGDGWSALDRAAGRGDTAIVGLLLEHGADPLATGKDLRTPYQIALAAGHLDAARLLRDAERAVEPTAGRATDRYAWRPYCKAFQLAELRRFPGWTEAPAGDGGVASSPSTPMVEVASSLSAPMAGVASSPSAPMVEVASSPSGDDVVFVHDDLTVTRSMWRDEDVIFADVTDEWAEFCRDALGFRVPDDFDLLPERTN